MSAAPTSLLRLALLCGVVALGLGLAGTPAASAAKSPTPTTGGKCWNKLIQDWYDGRIDHKYPVHCYKDALKNLPTDVKTYSDAYDVISRALADAVRGKKHVSPNELVSPPTEQSDSGTTTNGAVPGTGPGGGPGDGGATAGSGPIGGLTNAGDRGANGIPIPLLVLGGLALLLVAAGAAGLIARRLQSRGGPSTP